MDGLSYTHSNNCTQEVNIPHIWRALSITRYLNSSPQDRNVHSIKNLPCQAVPLNASYIVCIIHNDVEVIHGDCHETSCNTKISPRHHQKSSFLQSKPHSRHYLSLNIYFHLFLTIIASFQFFPHSFLCHFHDF